MGEMTPVSATALVEANNKGEGSFRTDQPASTTAWIRMRRETTETECGGWGERRGWRG